MFSRDFEAFMAKLPQLPDAMVEKLSKNESFSSIRTIFQSNPEKGLGLLFQNLYNPLCSYASCLVHSKQLAEDIVSEVFFQFYITKAYQTVHSRFADYLFKLVVNECFNHLQDQNKNLLNLPLPEKFCANEKPIFEDHYKNLSLKVASVMSQLSPQSQKIFSLSWFQNNNYFEIGQELKISPKTVEIQLLNAIRKLATRPHLKSKTEERLHSGNLAISSNQSVNIDTGFRMRIVKIEKSKFEKVFAIDKNTELPIFKQLVTSILRAIEEKVIEDGDRMPSIGKLSSFLSISRDKVQKAYYDLKKIGILSVIHGNGYFITKHAYWRENEVLKNFQIRTNESYDLMVQMICNNVGNEVALLDV